jgi:hypothetical protein
MAEVAEYGELFIGGELVAPAGQDVIEVVSPHTEEVIGRVPHASRADVDRAVAVARKALPGGFRPEPVFPPGLGCGVRAGGRRFRGRCGPG